MDATTTLTAEGHAVAPGPAALPSRKLLVWLFLGSEILFFSALIFTYVVTRLGSPIPAAGEPAPQGMWPIPLEIQGSGQLGVDAAGLDDWYTRPVADGGLGVHTVGEGDEVVVPRILNIPLTALNTFLLILSSLAVVIALDGVQKGRQKQLKVSLGITLLLGVVFLSIQAYEYSILIHEGLWFGRIPHYLEEAGRNTLFGTTFYAMTGFHGLHVFGGVVTLLIIFFKALKGYYTPQSYEGVELFGLYWHFVDLVWIILFTIVYLF